MAGRWKTARLADIPAASEVRGFALDEYREAMQSRAPHILERWADAGERFDHEHRRAHDVRGFFEVGSFGVNAFQAHEGELLVVPHDELGEGEQQEELYVVVEGRARFTCDGADLELGPGGVVACRAKVTRSAVALESPTTVLMVSGGDVPPNL